MKAAKEQARKEKSNSKKARKTVANNSSDSESPVPRQNRKRKLPARFGDDFESGNESDTVCGMCNLRDPFGNIDKKVFWIDCDACDCWFHVKCVCGTKKPPHRYVCENCS